MQKKNQLLTKNSERGSVTPTEAVGDIGERPPELDRGAEGVAEQLRRRANLKLSEVVAGPEGLHHLGKTLTALLLQTSPLLGLFGIFLIRWVNVLKFGDRRARGDGGVAKTGEGL
jgi:hypothetical protein